MNAPTKLQQQNDSLAKYSLRGACIAFVLGSGFLAFLFTAGDVLDGRSFLQGVWEFLPLVTVTAGGLAGGTFYFFIVRMMTKSGGWKKGLAIIFSVLIYMIILWLSLVAGLSVTGHWD